MMIRTTRSHKLLRRSSAALSFEKVSQAELRRSITALRVELAHKYGMSQSRSTRRIAEQLSRAAFRGDVLMHQDDASASVDAAMATFTTNILEQHVQQQFRRHSGWLILTGATLPGSEELERIRSDFLRAAPPEYKNIADICQPSLGQEKLPVPSGDVRQEHALQAAARSIHGARTCSGPAGEAMRGGHNPDRCAPGHPAD